MSDMGFFTIYGQVIDIKTGKGIEGATVIVDTVVERTRTSSNTSRFGTYLIDLESNVKSRLIYQADGYYPKTRGSITCSSHNFRRMNITLHPISSLTDKFSSEPNMNSKARMVTLETIIINSPKRVEYSRRLRTWRVI